MSVLFAEMLAYVGFGDSERALLNQLGKRVDDQVPGIVARFYDQVAADPRAKGIVEAHSSRARLEGTLAAWVRELLRGPYDAEYFERRMRIGRAHVRIELPPHYVFVAMNSLRGGLLEHATPDESAALNKLVDVELGVINQVYWDDLSGALQRQERMATIGELAGSFAHEIRNPLMAMQNATYLLRRRLADIDDAKVNRSLTVLEGKIDVCSRLVGAMLEFARHRLPEVSEISLPRMVAAVLAEIDIPRGVQVTVKTLGESPALRGDEVQLAAVVRNLVRNAIQALDGAGTVSVSIGMAESATGAAPSTGAARVALLRVEDDGPGVPEALQTDIFRPLVTTKTYGMGLGLPYCRRVAEAHGGTLTLRSVMGSGAVFDLELPLGGVLAQPDPCELESAAETQPAEQIAEG